MPRNILHRSVFWFPFTAIFNFDFLFLPSPMQRQFREHPVARYPVPSLSVPAAMGAGTYRAALEKPDTSKFRFPNINGPDTTKCCQIYVAKFHGSTRLAERSLYALSSYDSLHYEGSARTPGAGGDVRPTVTHKLRGSIPGKRYSYDSGWSANVTRHAHIVPGYVFMPCGC